MRLKWRHWAALDFILLFYIVYFASSLGIQFPDQYEIQNFPTLQQPDDITCGPTSTTMLLRYYGYHVETKDVSLHTKTTWLQYRNQVVGMTIPDFIVSALGDYNLKSKLKRGSLRELKYYISKNRPPIVLLRSGVKTWHYVVVIGYDKQSILIADPATGTQYKTPTKNFMGAWEFSSDMDGQFIGNDFYRFMILMADIQSKTYVVPVIE